MVINIFKWFHVYTPIPVWIVTIIAILFWWLFSWFMMKMVMSWKIRPARVVILAQRVIFLAGAIFIFNTTLVPVVLIAFRGMAFYTLLICAFAALLYFLRVSDKEESDMGVGRSYPTSPKNDDIFR
jgi:hypothetical protein